MSRTYYPTEPLTRTDITDGIPDGITVDSETPRTTCYTDGKNYVHVIYDDDDGVIAMEEYGANDGLAVLKKMGLDYQTNDPSGMTITLGELKRKIANLPDDWRLEITVLSAPGEDDVIKLELAVPPADEHGDWADIDLRSVEDDSTPEQALENAI
jgi:hypothetical protein